MAIGLVSPSLVRKAMRLLAELLGKAFDWVYATDSDAEHWKHPDRGRAVVQDVIRPLSADQRSELRTVLPNRVSLLSVYDGICHDVLASDHRNVGVDAGELEAVAAVLKTAISNDTFGFTVHLGLIASDNSPNWELAPRIRMHLQSDPSDEGQRATAQLARNERVLQAM